MDKNMIDQMKEEDKDWIKQLYDENDLNCTFEKAYTEVLNNESHIYVIRNKAFIRVKYLTNGTHICEIAVKKIYQRTGLASLLINYLDVPIVVACYVNSPANQLYKKLNFMDMGNLDGFTTYLKMK